MSRVPSRARGPGVSLAAALLALALAVTVAACSGGGSAVRERLDPDTATNLTLLSHPVELIATTSVPAAGAAPVPNGAATPTASTTRTSNEAQGDPFAYLAPFETDRSGRRELFLWIAPPASAGAAGQAELLCDEAPVSLTPVSADLDSLGLSHAPYTAPTPWADAWYYRISDDALRCLAQARSIALQLRTPAGPLRFTAQSRHLAGLEAFEQR